MRYLKTNTATIVTVGPFLDATNGVTLETGLTITNERISFVVDSNAGSAPTLVLDNVTGATSGTDNDLNYITNCDAGLMQLELSAANTNYLGRAFLTITDAANHCPVFHEFTILPAMVYDSLIAGSDVLQADMTQILGTAVSTPATAGILDVNVKNIDNAAVSTSTAQLGVNVIQAAGTAWGSGAITDSSIAADAITAAKIAAGAIDNATFAADVGSTAYATNIIALAADKAIQNYGALKPTTAGRTLDVTATGAAGIDWGNIENKTTFNDLSGTSIDSASAVGVANIDTGIITSAAFGPGAIDAAALSADAIAEIADAVWDEAISGHLTAGSTGNALNAVGTVSSDLSGLINDIGTNGQGLTALPWNAAWDAEVQSEVQDAIEVNHLDHLLAVDYDPASKPGVQTALWNELIESDAGVSRFTANALEQGPSGTGASAETIADAVWNEAIADHLSVGSTGAALNAAGSAGDPWTTVLPGAYSGSQAGKILADVLVDTGTTLQAELDGIQADTENIQTRLPAALISGRMDSDVGGYQTGMVPLFATVQGRALDVTATGAAGIDWGNIENKATVVNLEATSIDTASALVAPIALIDANVDAILEDTTEIGSAGLGLTQVPWNAAWDAEVQSEVQDAIEANHLDHLLAVNYDPIAPPGVATALLNELIESDAGVSRFTANALEQAPSGGGGTADWTADERTALRTILGIPASGTTPEVPSAGALKVIDDFLDTEISAIKAKTDNLPSDPADQSAVEAAITAATSPLATAAALATVDDFLDTEIAAILADTNELQTDWVNGGRLDLLIDAIKAKTDNLPATPAATGDAMTLATDAVSAAALSAAAVDEILDEVVEGSTTVRQVLRALLSLAAGKTSRAGSTIYFRDFGDTKNRLSLTVDTNADRTSVSTDLT